MRVEESLLACVWTRTKRAQAEERQEGRLFLLRTLSTICRNCTYVCECCLLTCGRKKSWNKRACQVCSQSSLPHAYLCSHHRSLLVVEQHMNPPPVTLLLARICQSHFMELSRERWIEQEESSLAGGKATPFSFRDPPDQMKKQTKLLQISD